MNNEYLAKAREQVPDAKTLIILASKRARPRAMGATPMVPSKDDENKLDVALREIAEGLLIPTFEDTGDDFMDQAAAMKTASSEGAKIKED